MSFVADNDAKRTFDPERDLELVTNGGGSDGGRNFILKGPGFQLGFSGMVDSAPIAGVDPGLPAPISKILIWKVFNQPLPIPGRSMEETRQIITEALTAFKGVHGYPAGQEVDVQFLTGWERHDFR